MTQVTIAICSILELSKQQTWNPSYVQDPIFRKQVWMSYGKNSTSIKQEDL